MSVYIATGEENNMERFVYLARITKCIDGDTVDAEISLGCNVYITERCRLFGINTKETYGVKKDSEEYKEGMIAKEWLQDRIEGKEVMIRTHKDKKGKYGRYLAEIFIDEKSINNEMVEKGLAVEYDGGKR